MRPRASRVGPWITPTLVVLEAALVLTGRLSLTHAVIAIVVIELALALAALWRARVALRAFRATRAGGASGWVAAQDALAAMLPRLAATAILIEVRVWVCLVQWLLRYRPDGICFDYGRGIRLLLWAVVGMVTVEAIAVDLVLAAILGAHSVWVWVALGLHLYALVWLVGLIGSMRVEPHRIHAEALELRDMVFTDVHVPLASITAASARRCANTGRSGLKVSGTVALLAQGDATVRIELDPGIAPVTVAGAARPDLASIDLTVDEPRRFLDALRERLSDHSAP